jgi:hypothetical protein
MSAEDRTGRSNYRTTADAGIPFLLHIEHPWPRAAECGRWAVGRFNPS